MMYQDKLVVALKVNGRVLREEGDLVSLPFGAEYSILIKNLNSVRAQVGVTVDGQDAGDGTKFIIAPNSSLELERFIKNGNFQSGNKFKFIERTGAIESHRGIGSDDGLIRVEGWKEHVTQHVNVPVTHYYDEWVPRPRPYYVPYPWRYPYTGPWCDEKFYNTCQSTTGNTQSNEATLTSSNFIYAMSAALTPKRPGQPQMKGARKGEVGGSDKISLRSFNAVETEVERSDAGITVPGSQSNQQFYSAPTFPLESGSVVIVMRLRGDVNGKLVAEPITVNTKPICTTCGKTNKAAQFCGRCGTALRLI